MMKRVLLLLFAFSAITFSAEAFDKKDKAAKDNEVHWISLDEVQAAMKKQPKKVLIDFYTGWCGWCKVMDRKTYSNPDVIKYINDNFYAVKFDAELKDTISFLNKEYGFVPTMRANDFAIQMLRGALSYPTTLIMMENFQNPQPIPGYLDVPKIEMIMKYLNENTYLTVKWEDYQKDFKPTFKEIPETPSENPTTSH